MGNVGSPALIALIGLFLLGAWLLGNGVTGLVISQSCCSGDSCSSDYLCDYAEPNLESPGLLRGWGGLSGGILVLVGSLFLWLNVHHFHS